MKLFSKIMQMYLLLLFLAPKDSSPIIPVIKALYQNIRYKRPILKASSLQLSFSFYDNIVFLLGVSYLKEKYPHIINKIPFFKTYNIQHHFISSWQNGRYIKFGAHLISMLLSMYAFFLKSSSVSSFIFSKTYLRIVDNKIKHIAPIFNVVYSCMTLI